MKTLRWVRFALALALVAGACLTARTAYLHAKAALAGILIREAWEQTVATGEWHHPWPWADTHPVARLRIPSLGYDEIVLEGATLRTLAFGPARLRSGAAPGEAGNLVLAGHRTSWFRSLEAVQPGDTVEIEWRDPRRGSLRSRTYQVESIHVIAPDDVALLAPTHRDALTLVTCYPFGRGPTSPQRFVVRAFPLGPGRAAR
jgi:sortase A